MCISELQFLQSRLIQLTHIFRDNSFKNVKDFVASVTLTKQRDHDRLGHNKKRKVLGTVDEFNDIIRSRCKCDQIIDLRFRRVAEGRTLTVTFLPLA